MRTLTVSTLSFLGAVIWFARLATSRFSVVVLSAGLLATLYVTDYDKPKGRWLG